MSVAVTPDSGWPQDLGERLAKPLIVSCAVTGSITRPEQLPGLPVTPAEIADSAVAAAEAGAACVHIHVREDDGTPSNRGELYAEAFERIRSRSDVLICATTGSGGGRFAGAERLTALEHEPDLASFDAGSMNFGERVFENSPGFLRQLARAIGARGVVPEFECFDVGMIDNVRRLHREGLLMPSGGRWWFQLCLGVAGGAACDAGTLAAMRARLPQGAEWSVLGVGRAQLPAGLIALVEGGHIRTGVEDNIYYRPGRLARDNAELVRRVVTLAGEVGRPVASPAEARSLIGCPERPRSAAAAR